MIRRATTTLTVLPVLLLSLALPRAATAQISLAPIFQDRMVLQRDVPIRIWGNAPAGEMVQFQLGNATMAVIADGDGKFDFYFPPTPAGGPHQLLANGTSGALFLSDVLVGDVWLCSGQSNMEWQMRRFDALAPTIAAANDPRVRFVTVARNVAGAPQSKFAGAWQSATPDTVRDLSCVAYHFAAELRRRENVPIGLIVAAVGGTPAEAWTRRGALAASPALQPIVERWDSTLANHGTALAAHETALAAWQKAVEAAKADGKTPPRQPAAPPGPDHPHRASGLFDGMIAPLVPTTIRGVIWYQGESNASRAEQYRTLFPTLIRDWRDAFGQGDLPFLFVQLANFAAGPRRHEWAELREAQREALTLPRTGMAVAIDLGESADIHPGRKDEVGRRLALLARRIAHGDAVAATGPVYAGCRIEQDRVRLYFTTTSGLVARGGKLTGFVVAGADRRFVPANAVLDGDTVVVSGAGVLEPRAVRYAWDCDPPVSLFDGEGLPASPFRTDDWPFATAGVR